MNLGVLNTIIAVVIVLLVLSLIVQAIQGLLKKLLKLKSKQIVGSLEDLYEQALADTPVSAPAAGAGASQLDIAKTVLKGWLKALQTFFSRVLRLKLGGVGAPVVRTPAQQFTDQILGGFTAIGRSSRWGNPVLDSLSKEDLLKIMAKLDSEGFVPDYVIKFQAMVDELTGLKTAIEALSNNAILTGAASAKLAEIRMVLAPLFYDVQAILEDDKVKPNVLLGDLLRLGNLKLNRVPELLNDAQQAITQEIEVASKSNLTDRVKSLNDLSVELAKIAVLIGNVNQKFDNAVAPLRIKLTQVATWYDTIMQSFDERYARNMKSWAVAVSIVVVILLNANFFNVYRSLSKNQVQTNLIVQNGQRVLEAANKAAATPTPAATKATPIATPEQSATPVATPASSLLTTANPTATPETTPTGTPEATPLPSPSPSPTPVNIKKEAEETKQNIDLYVNMYEDFGFSPLSVEQFRSWVWSTGGWTWFWANKAQIKAGTTDSLNSTGVWGLTITRNEKGVPLTAPVTITKDERGHPLPVPITVRKTISTDCQEIDNEGYSLTYDGYTPVSCRSDWRPVTHLEWWESRKHDASVLFGWAIMVLLLSVGAPFWQDALESLFGVKNLLRQKSGTQNIEKESGAGQPKQS
jgi:hypothetical protein